MTPAIPPTPPPTPIIPPAYENTTAVNENDTSAEILKQIIEAVEIVEEMIEQSTPNPIFASNNTNDAGEPIVLDFSIPADMRVTLEPQTTVSLQDWEGYMHINCGEPEQAPH